MKRKPVHPGILIKEDYLEPLSISIKDMADNLGVSRKTLSKIINTRGSVTLEMALRLSRAFDTTPDLWMNLQKKYDLWYRKEYLMNLSLSIDFNQLKTLIAQCGIEEKTELARMLEKDTFPARFNRLLKKIKTDELTLEEITAEVERVREKN